MSSEQITAERLHLAQWQERLQELVDQALSPTETLQVHAHLATCTMCTRAHRRLLTLDAQLKSQFAVTTTPTAKFEQTLFTNIRRLELEQHALARHREQQEHAARLAQLHTQWRGLLRFQLGNIIAAIATVSALITAIVSAWPHMAATMDEGLLRGAQQVTGLPHELNAAAPVTVVAIAVAIAATALWIARILDQPS